MSFDGINNLKNKNTIAYHTINVSYIKTHKKMISKRMALFLVFFMVIQAFSPFLMIKDARAAGPYDLTVTQSSTPGTIHGSVTSDLSGFNYTPGENMIDNTYTIDEGTVVTLTATPDTGYAFDSWGSDCSSESSNVCVLTMDAAKGVQVAWREIGPTKTITVGYNSGSLTTGNITSNPAGIDLEGGNTSAAFEIGYPVTFTATPDDGDTAFEYWSGGCTGSNNTCTITIAADTQDILAFFGVYGPTLNVTKYVSNGGNGTITSEPEGINITTGEQEGSAKFTTGTEVILTASPSGDSEFSGFEGDCVEVDPLNPDPLTCKWTAPQIGFDGNVSGTFSVPQPDQTLTVDTSGTGAGNVTSDPAGIDIDGGTSTYDFAYSTSVTLTPTAADGSTFASWSGDCSGTGTCTVTMTTAKNVTAVFNTSGGSNPTLTAATSGTGTGNVTSDTGGIDIDGGTSSASYTSGTVVTLTATAADGSTFTGWSGGDCTGTGTCAVTVDADTTVTANFNTTTFDITAPNTPVTKDGVTIIFNESLPTGATGVNITVTSLTSENPAPDGERLIKTYSISATNQDGSPITSGFSATITLPYPAGDDAAEENYRIVYWNGTEWSSTGITNIVVDTTNDTITFTTSHFSEFSVVEADNGGLIGDVLPTTGAGFINLFINLVLTALGCLAIIFLVNKSRYRKVLA
ncbi:MAG: hypothetical protein PHU86_02250 [Patescibacteria group bacterium]|nr:hypothetical protein [Patescibacteria group bacterium]